MCQPSLPIFRLRGFHADRDGEGRDLRADFHVGMHVVELTTGIPVLDPQPVLAVGRDNLKFLVVRNIESFGQPGIDVRVLERPLREQVHLGRGAVGHDAKDRED